MKQKTISATLAACIALSAMAFSSVVNATGVKLDWVAPAFREDDTAITKAEIAEFKIYYGTSPGVYDTVLTVERETTESLLPDTYTLTLPTGLTYYFTMTTVDTDGRESVESHEVTIPLLHKPPAAITDITVIEIVITIR